jgi:hypothetical protein
VIRSLAHPLAVVVALIVVVVTGCGGGTAPSTAMSTGSPTSSARPSTPPPVASAVGPSATATSALPPDASLSAEGGDPVVGQLGSFTWGNGGSDSPWLPGAPIAVGAGEPLAVTLGDATPIGTWSAVRAPADSKTGAGATDAGEGSGVIAFTIDRPGRWTVAVTIGFLAGGSATWYWQLEVT